MMFEGDLPDKRFVHVSYQSLQVLGFEQPGPAGLLQTIVGTPAKEGQSFNLLKVFVSYLVSNASNTCS